MAWAGIALRYQCCGGDRMSHSNARMGIGMVFKKLAIILNLLLKYPGITIL